MAVVCFFVVNFPPERSRRADRCISFLSVTQRVCVFTAICFHTQTRFIFLRFTAIEFWFFGSMSLSRMTWKVSSAFVNDLSVKKYSFRLSPGTLKFSLSLYDMGQVLRLLPRFTPLSAGGNSRVLQSCCTPTNRSFVFAICCFLL